MATALASNRTAQYPAHLHSRSRSTSDPFLDPNPRLAPPPPPKSKPQQRYRDNTQPPSSQHRQVNMVDAVRDTVTVRPSDRLPRTRMGRSQTALPGNPTSPNRPSQQSRRSLSQDSVLRAAAAVEKSKVTGGRTRSKKGSVHADVIDRMDFSGVGPMFHHDGPFDACAPSRNRHRTKAPMLAWSSTPPGDQRALANTYSPGEYESPYPTPNAYKSASPYESPYDPPKKKVDAIAEAWGIHEPEPFEEFFAGGGNGRHDDSAPNSVYNGRDRHSTDAARGRRPKDAREMRQAYRGYTDSDGQVQGKGSGNTSRRPPNTQKRSVLPPPQPVFIPDAADTTYPTEPPSPRSAPGHVAVGATTGLPKRSRSLMHRIKKMRDSPNVPMGYEDVPSGDGSPTSEQENDEPIPNRPTHRSQNSFLGRFGRPATRENANSKENSISPTSEGSDAYVYVEDPELPTLSGRGGREKSLPAPPHRTPSGSGSADYFGGEATTPGGSLGRKTSLLRKMRGVVRPNAK